MPIEIYENYYLFNLSNNFAVSRNLINNKRNYGAPLKNGII